METVFITIHDLSLDARIKYCSESIEYILGYAPNEVKGKSCWEYFHPEEIPFAREIHGRGIELDKAASLTYCRIKHKDGSWIGCECVFTVVYDVLVASTSIYRRGPKARQRALDGAGIRRIFSSSPRDPRYHMLSYLSNKFSQPASITDREPRAALFLNRFTRTSPIMFATNGVANILGIRPDQLQGKSFYYCIGENCLNDAVKTIESAKANDSIAYLRFWFRDPLQPDNRERSASMPDVDDEDEEDEDGGVMIRAGSRSSIEMADSSTPRSNGDRSPLPNTNSDTNSSATPQLNGETPSTTHIPEIAVVDGDETSHGNGNDENLQSQSDQNNNRSSSGNSTDLDGAGNEAIFDPPALNRSSSSMTSPEEALEIEAVISCTSDGLVVIMRRAKPFVPPSLTTIEPSHYANGLFASPWAPNPILPPEMSQSTVTPSLSFPSSASSQTAESGFMAAIRDVAVFAWSLTGINGSLADYRHGNPTGEALPPGGIPIWDPNAVGADPNDQYNGFLGSIHRPFEGMDEPIVSHKREEDPSSSDDEVLWKRTPVMPSWRRPKRRGHGDAFGEDGVDGVDGQNDQGSRKRTSKDKGQ